jgi:glycine/D-amino acid oxidase-like deaminating enzyme
MNNTFCIIGAGGFGLMTAFHLRKTHKDAKIIIFDINKSLSSSVNGGNGMLNFALQFPFKDIKNIIDINFSKIPKKIDFYLVHFINQLFNNKNNRDMIKKIAVEDDEEIECDIEGGESDYFPYNYWEKITKELIRKNVEIKDMTEIINYVNKDNKIIIYSKTGEEFVCDKLILCTATNLNLVKNKYYHQFIDVFSGYSAVLEVKKSPKCFYYKDGIFVTPYNKNQIKITFKIEIGYNNQNYNINKTNVKYNKLVEYITNNPEIQRLGLISIQNIWHGSRAMTYDIMPFIDQVDKNVYLLTGGGYMGTHMADNFGKWMVEYIENKPFTDLPKNNNIIFDPTLKRLEKIKNKYYFIFILLFLIIILIINYK